MVVRFYMPRLEVDGRVFQLQSDYNHVGSDESQMFHNPIVLNHETIEGKHVLLSFNCTKNTTEIADLSTRSGTFLDGQKIKPCEWKLLKHGQKLAFGNLEATFLTDSTDSDLQMSRDQSSQDSDHLEDYRIIPFSQIVQFPEEPKTLVAATQEDPSTEYSMADITLPETQFPGRSDWDEDDAALAALPDSALSPMTPEKRFKSIPETPDDSESDRSFHEHVILPETQSRPTSRASPVSSMQNFSGDDLWNAESQNLLADVQLPIQKIKPVEKSKKAAVIKKKDSIEISKLLKILSEDDDGDDTDCEGELTTREGSQTPELEELHQTEKTATFRRPNAPMALPQQAFVKIRKLQVPDDQNPNIFDALTQVDPYAAATQRFEPEAPMLLPQQPFVKIRKLQMPNNENPNIFEALTQVDDCELETQRFEPEATQKFDLQAFKKKLEQPKESDSLLQMRLSDFSDSQSSQSSSTPPCAFKLPNVERVKEILKRRIPPKKFVNTLFPESSDEEEEEVHFHEILSEAPARKTPAKKIMSQRSRQLYILDSPCPDSIISDSVPSKPSKSPVKRKLMENEMEAPKSSGSLDSEMLYRESPPHEAISSEYFTLPEVFYYPAPPKDEALLLRHLAESAWARFSKFGSTKISRRA